MKLTILAWSMGLVLAGLGCSVRAGPLEEACGLAYGQLSSVPNLSLSRTTGVFKVDADSYSGCIVRLVGDITKVKRDQSLDTLFYPFEGSSMYRQGWRADREADGPDGTSFRISRRGVFCLVEGDWDGGDDSNPNYVPSRRYEAIVSCSYQKR